MKVGAVRGAPPRRQDARCGRRNRSPSVPRAGHPAHNPRVADLNPIDEQPDDLDLELAQLLGNGGRDPLDDPATLRALAKLRLELGQDVIFVSRFEGGSRILELVESEPGRVSFLQGTSEQLERSWCYSVATGRLPEFVLDAQGWIDSGVVPAPSVPIGTHLSTPIRLGGGAVYGMLCAFSSGVVDGSTSNDLHRLRLAAEQLGKRLSRLNQDQARH